METFLILQTSIFLLPLFPALGELGLIWILIRIAIIHFLKIIDNPINRGWGILSIWLIVNSFFAYQPSEAFLGLAYEITEKSDSNSFIKIFNISTLVCLLCVES